MFRDLARKALAKGDADQYSRLTNAATRSGRAFASGLASVGLSAHDRNQKAKREIAAKEGSGRSPLWGDRLHRKLRKD